MTTVYCCSQCGIEFGNPLICEEHELTCKAFDTKECYKCGKTEEIQITKPHNLEFDKWHQMRSDPPGYGSILDGIYPVFNLCDQCLAELIDSFPIKYQERIYNDDGDETTEEWIEHNSK